MSFSPCKQFRVGWWAQRLAVLRLSEKPGLGRGRAVQGRSSRQCVPGWPGQTAGSREGGRKWEGAERRECFRTSDEHQGKALELSSLIPQDPPSRLRGHPRLSALVLVLT